MCACACVPHLFYFIEEPKFYPNQIIVKITLLTSEYSNIEINTLTFK